MRDDGIDLEQNEGLDQYVITERWRRVEQVLNSSTKVLKIWIAWGAAQSEVKNYIKFYCLVHHHRIHTAVKLSNFYLYFQMFILHVHSRRI